MWSRDQVQQLLPLWRIWDNDGIPCAQWENVIIYGSSWHDLFIRVNQFVAMALF